MHKNILNPNQLEMLPLIKSFSKSFYLVGGTALALQLGHRRSIDFDLFISGSFSNQDVRNTINRNYSIDQVFIETENELTLLVNQVKLTFFQYAFPVLHDVKFEDIVSMPDLLTIAAMKAYALGRRAKWKDYIDLFFIFKDHDLAEVVALAEKIFGQNEFNERLFREQLAFHDDINYSEKIDYLPGSEVEDEVVKQRLKEVSLQE